MAESYLSRLIRLHYREFSDKEHHVVDYFRTIENDLTLKTIANLADETSVSQATIFKIVKKLGFTGFQDFKISLAKQSNASDVDPSLIAYTDIQTTDSAFEIANKVVNASIQSLNTLRQSLTEEKLNHILEIIFSCDSIHFFGVGGSSVVAFDSYQKFIRTPFNCDYIFDSHMQLMYSTKLTKKDVVFIFSHSGQSLEIIKLARAIAESPAKLIVMSGNPLSELVKLADESIITYTEEAKFRSESLSSRILYLTLMDTIYVNIMYHDHKSSYRSMDNIRQALSVSKTDSDYIL